MADRARPHPAGGRRLADESGLPSWLRDPAEKTVWPGQVWRLHGERLTVGAIMEDGWERTALCTGPGNSVTHLPAGTLARRGTLLEQSDAGRAALQEGRTDG